MMRSHLMLLIIAMLCWLPGSAQLHQVVDTTKQKSSPDAKDLGEVVVSGTMKELRRSESPIPVEILTPKLFQKNPSPSLFEAVGMINGVLPQLNCNVCNTGDIHINGMEGPYTMILIDGMPIVSALSTVYGLSGIPNSLVERIEVVKGPASSLYGSEAMGGLINVITKNPVKAPKLSLDMMGTSWKEWSADAGLKVTTGKSAGLFGLNYFNYQNPIDNNGDGFTDMTQQHRVSVFNKWALTRQENRSLSIAARYVYEDRWGGQTGWNRYFRGGDSIYGESIYTQRAEVIGIYQLPIREKVYTQWSYNWHEQDSWYGKVPFMATQQVAFGQLYWDKTLPGGHSALLGTSLRYTYYDDNTPATATADGLANAPNRTPLPGIFVQDEWRISKAHRLLTGYRFDYDQYHGPVHSPRVAYKYSPADAHVIRVSFGTGYRVVNLFTEDHAALTGARKVEILEDLKPERSYNANLNYVLRLYPGSMNITLDGTAFYSYFTNRINADFDTDPDKIIYANLKGHAASRGVSVNADASNGKFKLLAGVTYADVYQTTIDASGTESTRQQLHAPRWSGTYTVSYSLTKATSIDFTGRWCGPMRLPILPHDYRPEYSPAFLIANVQVSHKLRKGLELYGGVKNLFDFVPKDPIMRAWDPFDKTAGDSISNPYGWTFDPSYNYAPMQGLRGFAGVRYSMQ